MTYEELFDAYRQVVSQRNRLASVGDDLWNELENCREHWRGFDHANLIEEYVTRWEALRGIGTEPPSEEWAEC
jgi:hypothetical protein